MIYHITTKEDWQQALDAGTYTHPSLAAEGFIHNSKIEQVPGVLNRYYSGKTDLLLLHIDEAKLTSELKYELAPSVNEMFPHIFGPINIDAVVNIETL